MTRLCILHILLYLHTLQKVSATNIECNVAKQCAEALECRLKTRQKSICAVQPRQRSLHKNSFLCKAAGNQFWGSRKAKPAENPHWSGTSEASLISYSATPRVFRRICLGAGPKTDSHVAPLTKLPQCL